MKTSTKKYLKLATILYLVLLAAAVVVTLGWFVLNTQVTLESESNFTISTGEHLEIGIAGENGETVWGSYITMPNTKSQKFPDITGNGKKFYYPEALDDADTPFMRDENNFTLISKKEGNESLYMLKFELQFKTEAQMEVFLSNKSRVEGKNSADKLDAIAGAVRMSFSELEGTKEILKSVWIPNEKYQYVADSDSFTETGTVEKSYGYLKPADEEAVETGTPAMIRVSYLPEDYYYNSAYDTDGDIDVQVMVGTDGLASTSEGSGPMINASTPLLRFTNDPSDADTKTLVIRVWVEGTDREAHSELDGSNFNFHLDFLGINKAALKTNPLEGAYYNGGNLYYSSGTQITGGIIYSYNGYQWTEYAKGATFEEDKTKLYIKTTEGDQKSSDVVVVDLPVNIDQTYKVSSTIVVAGSNKYALDGFTIDGDINGDTAKLINSGIDVNNYSGQLAEVYSYNRVGLYGWITLKSGYAPKNTRVGYYWEGDTATTWLKNAAGTYIKGSFTEALVKSELYGDGNSFRFHIQAPMSSAPHAGENTLHFVARATNSDDKNTYVELASLKIELQDDPDSLYDSSTETTIVDWNDAPQKVRGWLDAFTNGDVENALRIDRDGTGSLSEWNAASGFVFQKNTPLEDAEGRKIDSSVGLYGWAAFTSKLVKVGYYWNNNNGASSIIWQGNLHAETDPAVEDVHENAVRFHIDAPVMSAPKLGEHVLHYIGMLQDGTIVEFTSVTVNVADPTFVTTVGWTKATGYKAGSLDGFTTGGNNLEAINFPVDGWKASTGKVAEISLNSSAGLWGWAAYNKYDGVVKKLTAVGYYWDDETYAVTWMDDMGKDYLGNDVVTGSDLTAAGGSNAVRFHINAPISSAPGYGLHELTYVGKLKDGTIVKFTSWTIKVDNAKWWQESTIGFTAGDLNCFTINGNNNFPFSIDQWKGQTVDTATANSAGLWGWAAYTSKLTKVGYYWDDDNTSIIWQDDMGKDCNTGQEVVTEAAALAQGGVRFHIDAPMSTAPGIGKFKLTYVGKLADGTLVEFESWIMNILS